ncbi:MAG: aminotransferase class I/II-fold pyridoxal phosphate-dependent enzyme [Actinobacteria bacterium]|nr:aminotransferase class I/II-fold pyridoxal phosphate-dependent enzyme [Actinomycetota bacterium]
MGEQGPLQFDPEAMRAIGHRTVDALVEAITAIESQPVMCRVGAPPMRARLDAPPPAAGRPYDEVLAQVFADVVPFCAHIGAAGYMAFIPGFPTWPSAMGDLIASALMMDACWWAGGAGPSQIELTVLRWFADWLGYPATASGILVSGGSAANMTALACARERRVGAMRDDLVVYVSSQSHSSVARAARALGFRPGQLRVLPVDRSFRLRVDVLAQAVATDRAAGLLPLAVCANAGATNTGAVDPLPALADFCASHELWLHVDGAYGAFAALTARGRRTLAGIERADSITLDPHKWLFQPWECGAILVREPEGLRRAFEITPDYLRDVETSDEVNFSDRGLQLSRFCRALKVWMSLQTFGLDAFREAIDGALDLAHEATMRVAASPELELLAPVDLSVVAFRRRPAGETDERRLDAINLALVAAVEQTGEALVSSTRLFGRTAIRTCILNPTTTSAHVQRVLDIIELTPIDALDLGDGAHMHTQREPDIVHGWATSPSVAAPDVSWVPLFAAMGAEKAADLLARAAERRLEPGETLIEQWDAGRDCFVILDGSFAVRDAGQELATLEAGDLVGEIAALNWGAGYGAVRMAQVEALTPATVLVLTPEHLSEVLCRSPEALDLVERTARERLAQVQ